MNQIETNLLIIFYVIAAICILGNALVICTLLRVSTIKAITTYLVFILHVSCFFQSISSLPAVYNGNSGMCQFMSGIHYYTGLVNVGSMVILSIVYYNYTVKLNTQMLKNINRYGIKILYVFPLITFLPFATDSYGNSGDTWCTLDNSLLADAWSIMVFYAWVIIAFIISSWLFGYIIYWTSKHDIGIRGRLFWSLGIYILITLLSLLPRIIPRIAWLMYPYNISWITQWVLELPAYLAGICYVACYYYNQKDLWIYEDKLQHEISENEFEISFEDLKDALVSIDEDNRMSFSRFSTASANNNRISVTVPKPASKPPLTNDQL
jgi:hypothetical protein